MDFLEVPEGSPEGREIQRLQLENARMAAELETRQMQVDYVDCWLEGLTDRERWVIQHHIIDREIWHDIMIAFNARYTDDVSKDRLKRIQPQAPRACRSAGACSPRPGRRRLCRCRSR